MCRQTLIFSVEQGNGRSLSGNKFSFLISSQDKTFAHVCEVSVNKIARIKQSVFH